MTLAALLKESKADRESWPYTRLDKIANAVFAPPSAQTKLPLPAPLSPVRMVFVNGLFRADLSQLDGLPDGFLTVKDGAVSLRLEGQTCLALQPLGLLFLNDATGAAWESVPQIDVSLGENSRLTLLEKHVAQGEGAQALLPRWRIALAPQAKLVHVKMVQQNEAGLHVAKTQATIAAGAFYDHLAFVRGGGLTRCETEVRLQGELAGASLSGASLLRGTAQGDMVVRVFHEAPHASSRQYFKAVLDGAAKGVFQGKIHVAADAQKTDGYQLSRALLLSDRAEMNARPELEIYADDVKCSHGSAIGDLDEQALFYLRARGIDEKTARALLIEAFIADVLAACSMEDIATLLQEEARRWLSA